SHVRCCKPKSRIRTHIKYQQLIHYFMKKILYTFLIAATLFACADTPNPGSVDHVIAEGNIETMKQKREQVLATYDSVGKLLSKLELAIAEKDTTISHPLVTVFQIKDTV